LDHYEEGTWTPTLKFYNTQWNDMSYHTAPTTTVATYTRIGRLVYVRCKIEGFRTNSNGAAYAALSGLPYSCNHNAAAYIGYASCFATAPQDNGSLNADWIEFYQSPNWASWNDQASSVLRVAATYDLS
jgi:hypothetical protein